MRPRPAELEVELKNVVTRGLLLASTCTLIACGPALTNPERGNSARCVTGAASGDRDMIGDAVGIAAKIYRNPSFWKRVSARTWIASPSGPIVAGKDVAEVLQKVDPSQRGYAITLLRWSNFPFIKGGTIAATDVCGNVTIDTKHVETLEMAVNTVAHENAHVPGDGSGPIGCDTVGVKYRFTDGDYDAATKVWLVSYGIGDMAECFHLSSDGSDDSAFTDCMAHIIDGDRSFNRRHVECCEPGGTRDEVKLLDKVRRAAGTCADACSG